MKSMQPQLSFLKHSLTPTAKRARPLLLLSALTVLLAMGAQTLPQAFAQSSATSPVQGQCILAGRIDSDSQWAPRFKNLELLDADGKAIQPRLTTQQSAKDLLATVKQVRINAPAFLSTCNGHQAIPNGDGLPSVAHTEAPAVSAGKALIAVEAISYPPLGLGGEWVELKLALQQERVTMLASRRHKP
jgi:hypothetical protein